MKARQKEILVPLKKMDESLNESHRQLSLLAEKRRPEVFNALRNIGNGEINQEVILGKGGENSKFSSFGG